MAQLVGRFGSARAAIQAPSHQIADIDGFTERAAAAIRSVSPRRAEELLAQVARTDQHLLLPGEAGYPALLRSIPDPPPMLFARGDLSLLDRPSVAIIGSRDHSHYGGQVAARLGEVVARSGAVVVSGMARGLDAVAQNAALMAGGATIGVLGTGADVIYPARNRDLFDRVLHCGLLLSEHPPGSRPGAGAFPRRNRIISGLARALVVVEAAESSGTLITVTSALEQGREVFAVPGPISSDTSRGTNRLIRDGATPLLSPDELPLALGLVSSELPEARAKSIPVAPQCTLSPDEAGVLSALGTDAIQLDDLAPRAGLPIGNLLRLLLGLELGGLVEQLPGSFFRRRTHVDAG